MNSKNKIAGLLIILGVLGNNYAFFHDVINGEMLIEMGPLSYGVLVVSVLVLIAGIVLIFQGKNTHSPS